jgi:outer membrane protein assembly factor BamA
MRSLILAMVCTIAFSNITAQDSLKQKKWRFSPLPVVYYSPETRLGFGALIGANINLGDPSLTTTSYLQSSFIYTLNKQYEWSNIGRLYSPDNKRISQYRIYYAYFPESFYGVQTQTPEAFQESIQFNRLWLEFRQYWRISRSMYAGIFGRLNKIYNLESPADGSLKTLQPLGYQGYAVAGFAPLFLIDSRDSQVYTKRGFYFEFMWAAYPGATSDYTYGNVRLDARWFKSLNWLDDDALALQFFANLNDGNMPFRDMADIGGSNTMRGYYRGYYRYNNLYALQAEYRFMLGKYVGLVGWVGGCTVSEKWSEPFAHSIKPNAGIGLRIRINQKDKLNLRADYGFGRNQSGLYFDAAEAF